MFERIKHLLIKEFIQIFRDPRMRTVLFVPPLLQLFIFGYAASTDVKNISTGIYDLDNSIQSRELAARFSSSGYFTVTSRIANEHDMTRLLDQGDVSVVLHITKGFGSLVSSGKTTVIQVIVDGTDSNTARIAMDYGNSIIQQYSRTLLVDRLSRINGSFDAIDKVQLASRAWFNPNLESRNFFVPGVIAMIVLMVSLMLTSMAIVREKEIGTIEQIMVSPLKPSEYILGKTVPFALIGLFDVALISAAGVFWFDIPVEGSLTLLFVSTVIYLMTTLGAGLFISTISNTQQEAMMTVSFFNMPAMLLSGFLYPINNMPLVIQWITYLNPLRHFMTISRGIFLKGVGISVLWPEMLALFIIGIVTLWITTRRFKKTIA